MTTDRQIITGLRDRLLQEITATSEEVAEVEVYAATLRQTISDRRARVEEMNEWLAGQES